MNIKDRLLNWTINRNKYKVDSDAVILVSYFNPFNVKTRHEIFQEFYETIKHMPHLVVEGQYTSSKLVLDFVPIENKIIRSVESLNWCKEGLLNIGIDELLLKNKYKYVFWLDADIHFNNPNWIVDSCNKLRNGYDVVQPFKLLKHLGKDDSKNISDYNENVVRIDAQSFIDMSVSGERAKNTDAWFSFGHQHATGKSGSSNYEEHGHVGMAWGANLKKLGEVKLYDGALIGGADHIMAHAFANHTCHKCIKDTFSYDEAAMDYSDRLSEIFQGNLSFAEGMIIHIWHGDLEKRDYYRRIKNTSEKMLDNSEKVDYLYVTSDEMELEFAKYLATREHLDIDNTDFAGFEFGGGSTGGGGASGSWEVPQYTASQIAIAKSFGVPLTSIRFSEETQDKITNEGKTNLENIMTHAKNAGIVASVSGVVRNSDPIEETDSNIENTFS